MADDKMTGFSSAFDALMERTRQRFEDRRAGTFNRNPDRAAGPAALRAVPPPIPPAPAVAPPKSPEPSTRASSIDASPKRKRRKSEAVRRLNERFGEGWSYEVTERRREGDELIVLCRVDITDKDISKSQFGSAMVLKPGERFTLRGTVDGVPIGIAVGRGAPVTRDPEESAFRRAVDVALAKCAELLWYPTREARPVWSAKTARPACRKPFFRMDTMPLLNVGDMAPDFQAPNQNGEQVSLSQFRGKHLVLWFYPKADTPGWTIEGGEFKDLLSEFTAKNAQVLGISIDPPGVNLLFNEKFGFNFDLLSDEDRSVTLAYGADREDPSILLANRITYVIDPEGRIERVYAGVKPEGHAREVLDAL